ncbi:MAG: LamG domain-containing protein, partial [Saprospiraceae bacterium]
SLKLNLGFSGNTSDISGNNHHGKIIGNLKLTEDRFGNPNCAYQFPRDTFNFIKIDADSDFNIPVNGSFSISLWYSGGSTRFADQEYLFKKEIVPNSFNDAYYLELFDANTPLFGTGRDYAIWAKRPDSIPEKKWHHLVGTYNNKKWDLYQNDTLRISDQSDKYLINTSDGFISIGKLFEGKIDDIRFYNRALTQREVDTLYQLGSSCGITTGINSNDSNNHRLSILQNLGSHSLIIESPNSNKSLSYTITDLFGRELQHGKIAEENHRIELTEMNDGILILTIRDKNEILLQSKIFNSN